MNIIGSNCGTHVKCKKDRHAEEFTHVSEFCSLLDVV
jgi:hypothetical protein